MKGMWIFEYWMTVDSMLLLVCGVFVPRLPGYRRFNSEVVPGCALVCGTDQGEPMKTTQGGLGRTQVSMLFLVFPSGPHTNCKSPDVLAQTALHRAAKI